MPSEYSTYPFHNPYHDSICRRRPIDDLRLRCEDLERKNRGLSSDIDELKSELKKIIDKIECVCVERQPLLKETTVVSEAEAVAAAMDDKEENSHWWWS